MFRYSADRIPVLIFFALTALDFILYFTVDNFWLLLAYFVVMIIPKGCICAWNHHHQHTKTFNWTPLNRLLEQSYALHTGTTTNLWLLHHGDMRRTRRIQAVGGLVVEALRARSAVLEG